MEAAFGQVGAPFQPEAARCVDYRADGAIDALDYLELIRTWWSGCSDVGSRPAPGSCFFPGDINDNGCLDFDDYYLLAGDQGKEAVAAHPCADMSDDGFIDEVDLAFMLWTLPTLACPGVDFDPGVLLGMAAGQAAACGSAPPGDITGDGLATSADLAGVLSHFGLTGARAPECLDINRDGSIDMADALHVMHLSVPADGACLTQLAALEDFVADNKACSYDTDCEIQLAGCSQVSEHCSRVVYLNAGTDEDQLTQLILGAVDCLPLSSCRACTATAPPPRCNAGSCEGGP